MKYEKNARMSMKAIDNEVFVLNRESGVIHSFNGSGGEIFKLIMENTPIESLVAMMIREYDVDESTAHRDILAFLKSLEEKGLVTIHGK